jgi:GT2 family glycosyltransferase
VSDARSHPLALPEEAPDPGDPRISVVVACFDQARELRLTLLSFLRQRTPLDDYELIVVDDHSPDASAHQTVAELRRRFPAARLLYARRHRSDGGTYGASAVAKNVGLRLARGRYVFFNNAEIVQAGESLEHVLAAMAASRGPLCLRGRVLDLPYESLVDHGPGALADLHDRTDRGRERVATADHAGLAAVPRAALLAVGGNDERFDHWGKEDLDLAARLKRHGVTYVYDEDLKSFHVAHPPNHRKEGDYLRMCRLLAENDRRGLVEANRGRLWGQLERPPAAELEGTVVVWADGDRRGLEARLERLLFAPGAERREVLVACLDGDRPAVEGLITERFRPLDWMAVEALDGGAAERILQRVRTDRAILSVPGAEEGLGAWQSRAAMRHLLRSLREEESAALAAGVPS